MPSDCWIFAAQPEYCRIGQRLHRLRRNAIWHLFLGGAALPNAAVSALFEFGFHR